MRTTVNNHATRIGTLERKKPTIHVGEIITTFKDYGNTYKINGVTYLYCGTAQSIANTQYPQLMEALGLVGVVGERPHVNDLMPDIVKCIEKEESKRNIVLASKWYGNDDDDDYSPSMFDYLCDDDYDFSSLEIIFFGGEYKIYMPYWKAKKIWLTN